MSSSCKFFTTLIAASMVLNACDAGKSGDATAPESETTRLVSVDAARRNDASSTSEVAARTEASVAAGQLTHRLEQARADRAALMLRRDSLAMQVEAQQAQGREVLTEIRSELAALRDQAGGADAAARYENAARERLESALVADEKLRTDLEAVNSRLTDLDSQIAMMDDQLAAQHPQRQKQASSSR